jgi:hypothetical protein
MNIRLYKCFVETINSNICKTPCVRLFPFYQVTILTVVAAHFSCSVLPPIAEYVKRNIKDATDVPTYLSKAELKIFLLF